MRSGGAWDVLLLKERTCSDNDVLVSYRILSRIVHPDKTPIADAVTAFQILNNARSLLVELSQARARVPSITSIDNNSKKRKRYEQEYLDLLARCRSFPAEPSPSCDDGDSGASLLENWKAKVREHFPTWADDLKMTKDDGRNFAYHPKLPGEKFDRPGKVIEAIRKKDGDRSS